MFKNREFNATDVYMPCANFLSSILDTYVKFYRPYLEGAKECSYLLRGCSNRGTPIAYDNNATNINPICTQTLWIDTRIATSLVDDGNCNGWSTQLFRTLTTIGINAIIGGQEGSEFAAHVLCDSKEVAEKNYNLIARDDSLNEYTKMVNAFDDGKEYRPNSLNIRQNDKDTDINRLQKKMEKERNEAIERELDLKNQINALIKKLDNVNEQKAIFSEVRKMKVDILKRLDKQ